MNDLQFQIINKYSKFYVALGDKAFQYLMGAYEKGEEGHFWKSGGLGEMEQS